YRGVELFGSPHNVWHSTRRIDVKSLAYGFQFLLPSCLLECPHHLLSSVIERFATGSSCDCVGPGAYCRGRTVLFEMCSVVLDSYVEVLSSHNGPLVNDERCNWTTSK